MTAVVTPADTVRWLHDSGLNRLAAFAGDAARADRRVRRRD